MSIPSIPSTKNFYTKLPIVYLTLNQLLESPKSFESAPADWYVILTDIVNSTEHFKAENYQEINLIAVSSVSIILNTARKYKIIVPFVYGGDGATFLVPPSMLVDCKGGLATLRKNALDHFKMDLRVSIISVQDIMEAGFSIHIAKLFISSHYHQAIFLGEGIRYAESLMKHAPEYILPSNIKGKQIDLSGLECKWNALFPPRLNDEVISLIVHPKGDSASEIVFHKVLEHIEKFFGSFEERHPIHPRTLSPTTHLKTIIYASHLRYGRIKLRYVLVNVISGILKSFYLFLKVFWHKIFNTHMADMSTSSDTLKIDNTLKTIFAGTREQRILLVKWLKEQEEKGELVYGLSVSYASVMTCYIKESHLAHVRFLDGFGGGYTLAALELKKKLLQ